MRTCYASMRPWAGILSNIKIWIWLSISNSSTPSDGEEIHRRVTGPGKPEVQCEIVSQRNEMERDKTRYPMPLATTHTAPTFSLYICALTSMHHTENKKERRKDGFVELNWIQTNWPSRTQFKGWCGRLNQTAAIPSCQQWTGRTPYYKDTAISLCKDWYLENKHGSVFVGVKT